MGVGQGLKRLVVGRPMATGAMGHTLLPKTIALPVFSSDALSSVAYATQEILLVLGLAGAAALPRLVPISFAVAGLLALVVISYRQTVRAYPNGGGAYIVSRENLGDNAGLLAASALLIDYVLTVSVSITAGTEAVLTAAPGLAHLRVEIAMIFIAFVATVNLRGVKESGVFFAVPTYLFIASIATLLLTGFVKCLGGCPIAESATTTLHAETTLSVFLLLKAFAAGTTALTGVEAISNGVPAFRYPQSHNAATTLTIMGTISISMFLGVSWLANQMQVRYVHGQETSVLGEIAHGVFGGGFGFYVVQIATAAILILAANTAFADFPRLASILATDRFMPRQFMNRGDRLVFSNGVLILSVLASLLIVVFRADLNRLIQLYLVGVFVSFTLSQTGMVVHWRKLKEPGWRRSIVINAVGATMTAVVLCVVIVTKFLEGAWIVVAATPLLMLLMKGIHTHYMDVKRQLDHPDRRPRDRRQGDHSMVILVNRVDAATAHAVGYVRSTRPRQASAITFDKSNAAAFKRMAPEMPIVVLERTGSTAESIMALPRREPQEALARRLLQPRDPGASRATKPVGDLEAPEAAPPQSIVLGGPGRTDHRHPDLQGRHRSLPRRDPGAGAQLRGRPRLGCEQRDASGDRVCRDSESDRPKGGVLRSRSGRDRPSLQINGWSTRSRFLSSSRIRPTATSGNRWSTTRRDSGPTDPTGS